MIPYTDKAKKALNYANRLSRSSGCNYVGTEHILAGLLKEGTGVAAEVLTANNVELEALLKLIDELVAAGEEVTVADRDGYSPRTRWCWIVPGRWQTVLTVNGSEPNTCCLPS